MRLVFMGTPQFAIPSLKALVDAGHEVSLVVTRPDAAKGRKRLLTPPEIKRLAEELGLLVYQPENLKDDEVQRRIKGAEPELAVVVAYGKIIPKWLLESPERGVLNVHASLLPKYRGANPIQRAIMNGEWFTGVAVQKMVEELDAGDVIAAQSVPIEPDDTLGTLTQRLSLIGAATLVEAIKSLADPVFPPVAQNAAAVTWAPKLEEGEEKVDWANRARAVHDLARALDPAPGAKMAFKGETVKVWRADPRQEEGDEPKPDHSPGEILAVAPELLVAAGDAPVALIEVQPAGKARMSGAAFARGRHIGPGARFE